MRVQLVALFGLGAASHEAVTLGVELGECWHARHPFANMCFFV